MSADISDAIGLLRPATLRGAAQLLARDGALAVAGGTDLLPNLRRGLVDARVLVDLGAVKGLASIERDDDGGWRIGAGVTLSRLARDAALAGALPALAQAASQAAAPALRSAATLGGNLCQDTRCVFYNQSEWWRAANGWCLKLKGSTCHVAPQGERCHATYAGDLAPALLAYGATVELVGASGRRRLPLAELYRDDGAAHLALASGELLGAVQVAAPHPASRSAYRKVCVRGALDFALAGVAMVVRVDGDGRLAELAVGLTGTNSQPLRLREPEVLLGRPVDDAAQALGKLVARQASPMRSTVSASNHRRLVAATTAERLLRELTTQEA